ncbi:MAG TPA: glycosyltransferase family 2 protein, partial [Candidatus Atribacteria bacterium]|nr:glycosyltransferase family 2 protein [Candidatus Atribacteria bacterium]
MKLIVTIPAYNEEATIASVIKEIPRQIKGIDKVEVLVCNDGSEDRTVEVAKQAGADYIISQKQNKGLAETFKLAIEKALEKGADIIVNTDADNHYNQSRIPDLIKPILENKADIVIGGREVNKLNHMPFLNKYGNILGSKFVCRLANLPKLDVSSGFRAYSREAALRMNILSPHTYTHESLIQAHDHRLIIKEDPIPARKVKRKSRLIKSIPKHILKSLAVIFRVFTLYKPMRVFLVIGGIVFLAGLYPFIRFLYFYFQGQGSGHIQSLIAGMVLLLIGFNTFVLAL